ncbi:MAG TPA: ParA family protein [Leucothrix mucor]|uniref:ParA family protein n=1 Tax=Leucothrix mucor TaxID=45248 RepID=A0A7V2T1N5_LEUMU|nr:ParA family protein [Leucothrix mucor]
MISVIGNLKGGTGKSTVAFNLSLWVATNRNVLVAVYDFDPQATLTDALEIRAEDGHQPTIVPKNRLEDLLKEAKETEVLVDIGMSDMDAMRQAIEKADRVIIPIAPSQADVWSTQRFIGMVKDIRGAKMPEMLGFINRADTHIAVRETDEAFEALSTLDDIKMLDEKLYQRTAYRRSFSEGLAVFEMDKMSKASQEVEALGGILY